MHNYSVMLYGSSARGDGDKQSDLDVLVAAEKFDEEMVKEIKSKYPAQSLNTYSYTKLQYMAHQGYLFMQHLKQDGKIVIDKEGVMERILNSFHPKNSYRNEILDAVKDQRQIKFIGKTKVMYLWYLDIAYISVRNIAFLSLADRGTYVFNFRKAINLMSEVWGLDGEECSVLHKLRDYKHSYRNKMYDNVEEADVWRVVEIISKIVNEAYRPVMVDAGVFYTSALSSISEREVSNYFLLRLVEGIALMSKFGTSSIKRVIEHPRLYSAKIGQSEFISLLLSRIGIDDDFVVE